MTSKMFRKLTEEQETIAPGQTFDLDYTLTKTGRTYNLYDSIQEAREDTEIEPTLKKYGCIDRMIVNMPDVYADLRGMNDLKSTIERQKKGQEIWDNMPREVKEEFNNNIYNFMDNGMEWAQKKQEEQAATIIAEQEAQKGPNNE
jgi:predicted transcriptional regulator